MDTRFGVGLSTFLFEQKSDEVKSQIAASINRQTTLYMPFISINQIVFPEELGDVPVDPNSLDMRVEYSVPSIGLSDFVDISIW